MEQTKTLITRVWPDHGAQHVMALKAVPRKYSRDNSHVTLEGDDSYRHSDLKKEREQSSIQMAERFLNETTEANVSTPHMKKITSARMRSH